MVFLNQSCAIPALPTGAEDPTAMVPFPPAGNQMSHCFSLFRSTRFVALLLIIVGCGDRGSPPDIPTQMESVEESTEHFANAMLDLGIALGKGDLDALRRSIPDPIEARTMTPDFVETTRDVDLIRGGNWGLAEETRSMTSEDFVHETQSWLEHFSEIEDVRFKVKKSTVQEDGNKIEATLALAFVGRNHEGRREWARGRAQVHAVRHDKGRWQLDRFEMMRMGSLEAEVDVFSEVALPVESGVGAFPLNAHRERRVA